MVHKAPPSARVPERPVNCVKFRKVSGIQGNLERNSGLGRSLVCPWAGGVVDTHDVDLEMRLKIEAVFEHYAAKSEYYRRANIAQRFEMEDAFYRLTMELLGKIIGPFDA